MASHIQTWIALLRGVNVGGRNVLPMKALREELSDLGLKNVRTYIQSGNCVFECGGGSASSLEERISGAVERRFGFRPAALAIAKEDLEAAIAANPFPEAAADPKSLHLYFLARAPTDPDLEALEALRAPSERFVLSGRLFYLHAPDGVARSGLAAQAEARLGVSATARNLRSAIEIAKLAA